MKKILFLPLFKMASGHHQVADAVMEIIVANYKQISVKKIDCLSYWSKPLEQLISSLYMKWISMFPKQFEKFYHEHVYKVENHTCDDFVVKSWPIIEYNMKRLVESEKPDVIVCTHSFPSRVISGLKEKGIIDTPLVNIYTDFLVSDVWGKNGVDIHCVPDKETKNFLQGIHDVPARNIYVTGIPVHAAFTNKRIDSKSEKMILIAGGNAGLGNVKQMLSSVPYDSIYQYVVLCGNNKKLFQELVKLNHPSITPLPYIACRKRMNCLYEQASAVVTKAGGVTISEALRKRLPIFIHSSLPGQEQVNIQTLKRKGLLMPLNKAQLLEDQLVEVLENDVQRNRLLRRMDEYIESIEYSVSDVLANQFHLYEYETTKSRL
ncbi:MGDG synthase family glycosyltransferase [Priestia flexa]|uniref:MGDG synthase family glycosyltransferase n=1 Tax=Priestia flexa TaxID=86664 RepID=UPI0010FC118D|nr:glycosyltransferase [Priestia flexa]QCS52815.1 galactosyldiacylglycerol synthase [Priestia flexa]